jgi:hypothetical protein
MFFLLGLLFISVALQTVLFVITSMKTSNISQVSWLTIEYIVSSVLSSVNVSVDLDLAGPLNGWNQIRAMNFGSALNHEWVLCYCRVSSRSEWIRKNQTEIRFKWSHLQPIWSILSNFLYCSVTSFILLEIDFLFLFISLLLNFFVQEECYLLGCNAA